MHITDSTVSMAAQRSFQQTQQQQLDITIEQQTTIPDSASTNVTLSNQGVSAAASEQGGTLGDDPRVQLLKMIVEIMVGHKIKLGVLDDSGEINSDTTLNIGSGANGTTANTATDASTQTFYTIRYNETYQESESVNFASTGIIKTSDGQEIQFQAELQLSRSYSESVNFFASNKPAAMDPLVINYDAPAATLSNQKFAFDLNSDGAAENISQLNAGSGFLALDQNQDGIVNDGNELFGTQSGDGFADLAAYDKDQNGWIDEADSVYAQLKVWIQQGDGSSQLLDLQSLGVGAIYLGHAQADFNLTDNQNNTLGQVRSTGIYLNENGTVGSVQQVDLVV